MYGPATMVKQIEDEKASGYGAGGRGFLPDDAVSDEREDAEEGEEEGEGFGEIGEAEREAHERGVLEVIGGEVFEERGEGEDEEDLEESVGADLAHAEFALRGDDEDGDAEVAEDVAVEKEGSGGWG